MIARLENNASMARGHELDKNMAKTDEHYSARELTITEEQEGKIK
jgi:hypothetical protein